MNNTNYDKYLKAEIQKDPSLKTGIDMAKGAIEIAQRLYDLRKARKLTQKELASLISVKQSSISRLESGDYSSYTFKTWHKVANALKVRLNVELVPLEKLETATVTYEISEPIIWNFPIDFQISRTTEAGNEQSQAKTEHRMSDSHFTNIWI